MSHRYFGRSLRTTALVVSFVLPMGLVSLTATHAAADEMQLPPEACAGMTAPAEENHASIRLDLSTTDAKLAVDQHGKIPLSGVLHKKATMVDVSVGHVTTKDFTIGPPPDDVAAWASSWQASLRPAQLGPNLVCARAERDPKRTARVLRSVDIVDLLPPSDVSGLAVGAVTDSTAKVTWGAATDNYGLAGYEVRVDGGAPHRTTAGTRTYTITGLKPATDHTVSVVAVDLAGNTSKSPATASFRTKAPPPPPNPDAELAFVPEEGGATATWHPDPSQDVTYKVTLDGTELDSFDLDRYCQDADGKPADPCTAKSVISYPIEPLEQGTPYTFQVVAVGADGKQARGFSGDFTTTVANPEVDPATTQLSASEASQCAVQGGDFYVAADARAVVKIPGGSTQLFPGCYRTPDSSCIDAFLPPSGEKILKCADDVTKLLYDVAPPGRGPVISGLKDGTGAAFAPSPVIEPVAWCIEGGCTTLLAPVEETVEVVATAELATATTAWVVVAAEGIGLGIALWALLEILFPGEIAIGGLLEYPIHYNDDFDTFDNWGADDGDWYNSLKVYAEVIRVTQQVAGRDGLPFAWDDTEDARLKRLIDQACTAQRGSQGIAGCDENVTVYVPGGQNYKFKPMPETGTHIVAAMGNGSYPQPPARSRWFYPARSQGGQAAQSKGYRRNWFDTDVRFQPNSCQGRQRGKTCDEFPFWSTNQAVDLSGLVADLKPVPNTESLPQGSDISAFYSKCKVKDTDRFIVLPIKPWVEANGPSFGFHVSPGGASMCMTPTP